MVLGKLPLFSMKNGHYNKTKSIEGSGAAVTKRTF